MPKAKEVAAELRKLAESLEREPEADVNSVHVSFYCDHKNEFLKTARLMPRPLKKSLDNVCPSYPRLDVTYKADGVATISASVPQSVTCELIQPARPAVYRCDPILSLDEEESIAL